MRTLRTLTTCALVVLLSTALAAQPRRITVVDQTGLPLPGVTIQLYDGDNLRTETVTESDGSVELDSKEEREEVVATLAGFQPARVPAHSTERIVLELARAEESTTVVAPASIEASPTALAGSTLTQTTVMRLPSAHMHARESLPLLPSVTRGADGLMQLGGAKAYQTPLTLDGFNVTDPATGLSSLNLPIEAVLSIDALRDPMAVTYGGLLGGLIRLESRSGGSMPAFGVQGFIPRPHFGTPGFGRLEGIFPRAHLAGSASGGRVQYVVAGEYDYERIPVPEVTDKNGPDLVETSGIVFGRVDAQLSDRSAITLEAFSFPSGTQGFGLSPRRDIGATVDLTGLDRFAGVTHRHVSDRLGVVTIRAGAFSRSSGMSSKGFGPTAVLTPAGWTGNWFADGSRQSYRYSASASWDRPATILRAEHELSVSAEAAAVSLSGHLAERPIRIESSDGVLLRTVTFGPAATLHSSDVIVGIAARDVWHVNPRVQIESGVRVDRAAEESTAPSARVGLRYQLDSSGKTMLKAGIGTFVGQVPLSALAFESHPVRTDTWFDATTGEVTQQLVLQPAAARLRLPQARTLVVGIEREIMPGLDVQSIFTGRHSFDLPTLDVPTTSGEMRVESTGTSSYRELQLSIRRTWPHDQVLFVSYVRSSAVGELNEFATLFQTMDAPLVDPGGRARTSNDARDRVLAWGTFNLPFRMVVSPATEWRSGFTYSSRSSAYAYAGSPNTFTFPNFLSTDLVAYKTFTVKHRSADFGVQVFNLFNRWNPRDVFPVVGQPRYGQFSNSVGRIFRGYMLIKW